MSLFVYQSEITVDGNESDSLANHLWHFSNPFPAFTFSINGIGLSFLATSEELSDSVKPDDSNHFSLDVTDDETDCIIKVIEALNLSLQPHFDPLSFSLGLFD